MTSPPTVAIIGTVYDRIALEIADHQHGVVGHWQLLERGVSAGQIRLMAGTRHWGRARPTVLRREGSGTSTAQEVLVALLSAGPGCALGHDSGANWWGHNGSRLWPLQVVTTSRTQRHVPGVRRRQVRRLPQRWITQLGGVPIVRPEVVAMHLFADHHEARAERVTETLWSMRLLSARSLQTFVDDLGARGRNGVGGLRRFLEDRPVDYVPPATGLESRTRQILRAAGIEIEAQVNLGDEKQWSGRVDFRVAGTRVIIEVQSERHHRALVDTIEDRKRRQRLEAAGFVWVEVWDNDVWTAPDVVVAQVLRAMRSTA